MFYSGHMILGYTTPSSRRPRSLSVKPVAGRLRTIRSKRFVHDAALNRAIALIFLQLLPKRDDLTPLTDPMWIAKILSDMPAEISQAVGAGTRWKGVGRNVETVTLL